MCFEIHQAGDKGRKNQENKGKQLETKKKKKNNNHGSNHSPLPGCEMNNIGCHSKANMICLMGSRVPFWIKLGYALVYKTKNKSIVPIYH